MKIVIDIPEERYNEICVSVKYEEEHKMAVFDLNKIISEGKPLPKGHGRLIDADAELEGLRKMKVVDEKDKQSVRFSILNFETAPTIIEAESEDVE